MLNYSGDGGILLISLLDRHVETHRTVDYKILDHILQKIHSRSLSRVIAFTMALAGIAMIFLQIKETGVIDIKSQFLSGKLQSSFVGISLIFFASVTITLVLRSVSKANQEGIIEIGELKITHRNLPSDNIKEIMAFAKQIQGNLGSDISRY